MRQCFVHRASSWYHGACSDSNSRPSGWLRPSPKVGFTTKLLRPVLSAERCTVEHPPKVCQHPGDAEAAAAVAAYAADPVNKQPLRCVSSSIDMRLRTADPAPADREIKCSVGRTIAPRCVAEVPATCAGTTRGWESW